MSEGFGCIGRPADRLDAWDKVTGKAIYAGDIYLPGMLHGVTIRSPFPHARILKLDSSAALTVPGVKAVLTAADLPQRLVGDKIKDQPVLALDTVRFIGERVAAVAAVDEATARKAAELIRIDYHPLPAVFTAQEALQPGAPLVHEDLLDHPVLGALVKQNIYAREQLVRGSLEEGWCQSDLVFKDTFTTQSVHQGYLEGHAVVVQVDPGGKATVWSSNKVPFRLRQMLEAYLGLPENSINVVAPIVGGEFGGKGVLMDEPVCYCLSLATGRPVRMVMRYGEELAAANPRHPARITIKSGVKKNGELVARQVTVIFDSGAYGGAKPTMVPEGYSKSGGPYRIPHLLIEGYAVYTNNEPRGHCRAPGHPQTVFAVESHTDLLARRLGMDPYTFRLQNVLTEGEVAPTGEKWHDLRGREVLEAAVKKGGWNSHRATDTGRGLALAYRHTGGGESGAIVSVGTDGFVQVLTGTPETGAGAWTVLAQIAAEELGTTPEKVKVVQGDTDSAPADAGSGASRSTHVAGFAVFNAARDAAQQLKAAAAQLLDCPPEEVAARSNHFWHPTHPEIRLAFREVAAKACAAGTVTGKGSYKGNHKDTMAFMANLAEIRVDRDTGKIEVKKIVAAHDIGCIINPPAAEGQVEGCVIQGAGFALSEELVKRDGKLASPSLADYQQLTSADTPEIDVVFLEGAPGPAPYGSKGIGEVPIISVAAAIANALEDAVGIRINELPLTPEKVWRALREKEERLR